VAVDPSIYRQHFPNFDPSQFVITSPKSPAYNCIAYAAGREDMWWWPDVMGFAYWPPSVLRLENLEVFQEAFETLGYSLCSDGSLEDGFEKIAIYHKDGVPTHGARQLENGVWASKLGREHDVVHGEKCLDGEQYGTIAFFMKRPRTTNTRGS
jgi:hypothetical protein